MLDIAYIRENAQKVKEAAKNKGLNPKVVDNVLDLDSTRRELIQKAESYRSKRNQINDQLKSGRSDELIQQSIQLKTKLQDIEPELKRTQKAFDELMLQVPNVPAEEVPIGSDSSGNEVVRKWGEPSKFSFKIKDHIELGLNLDLIDLDRGTKVSGFRGYFLKNEAVMMQLALMQFALDKLKSKGFSTIMPPIIVRNFSLYNTGHFPWGHMDVYKTYDDVDEKDERFLAGTAEVPLVSYHANETLPKSSLPLLYAGFSPCYRREVGSYGKDTRGLYRVHEFYKIEQVVICENSWEESVKWHENLASYSEEILQDLELPYQVLLMCTGDMGEPQMKKYDIETWMPSRGNYGETMSDSIMGEFQARRANIRYRDGEKSKFVHTLNNTALASPRIMIALWENHQQEDGSINIPQALRKYMGNLDQIKKR